MRALSASLTETNKVPVVGRRLPLRKLAFGEGDRVAAVDAHDLARGSHLRTKHRIDFGEALEGENRLLDPDMCDFWPRQLEIGELFSRHHARRDGRHGMAYDLGDEWHRAACARIDLQHVDLVVLDRELDVHEFDNVQSAGDVPDVCRSSSRNVSLIERSDRRKRSTRCRRNERPPPRCAP